MSGKLVLVGGGARAGKSSFALSRARAVGRRRSFIATAQPLDDSMRQRIARHVADRGDAFQTVEEPRRVAQALQELPPVDVVVLDCLTLWLSNLLVDGMSEDGILESVDDLIVTIRERNHTTIIVTNEVGMGVHPPSELGLVFQDIAGRAHQKLGAAADEVYFALLGSVIRIKPELGLVAQGE